MKPQISILIPAYNQFQLTQHCLQTLLENTLKPQEIVIVDNASTDETTARLPEWRERFTKKGWSFKIIRNDVNQGFGRAVNRAFHETGDTSFVAVLGNDTWVMPAWDEALVTSITRLQADMIGPYVDERPFDPSEMPYRALKFVSRNKSRAIKLWESALMFFKKDSFARVGLFDERFYLTYEDTDLQTRMDQAGMTYYQVGNCYMWHKGKATRGEETAYEKEGLKLFLEKWGFDPRRRHHTFMGRLKRRWKYIRNGLGLL